MKYYRHELHREWVNRVALSLHHAGRGVTPVLRRQWSLVLDDGTTVAVRVAHARTRTVRRRWRADGRRIARDYSYTTWLCNAHVHGRRLSGVDLLVCVLLPDGTALREPALFVVPWRREQCATVSWHASSRVLGRVTCGGYETYRDRWDLTGVAA